MKTYTEAELNEILRNHKHWILEDIDGWEKMRADLRGADLRGAQGGFPIKLRLVRGMGGTE